jgi:CBS domain-containing protein
MKISELIARQPVCAWVSPRTSIFDAAQMMKLLDVGMLPVCDHNKLVGTVTDRDIVVRAIAKGVDARQTEIAEIMTEESICCFDDQESRAAAELMREHGIRRLPVLNHDNRLVGIVSLGDVAAGHGDEEFAGEVLARIAVGSLGE